jgi:magnesium transporter
MQERTLDAADLLRQLADAPQQIDQLLENIHPQDVADALRAADEADAGELFEQLPNEYAAQVFERLEDEHQEHLVQTLGVARSAELAREMDPDDRADFFSLLPPNLGDPILARLNSADPEIAEEVRELQQWPTTSAGGLMTTDYVSIGADLTIADAIAEVRQVADEVETLDTLFVTTRHGLLLGTLSLKRMLLSSLQDVVSEVMARNVKSVPPELDQEEVARVLAKYDLNTLPVVTSRGVLLGVITADDVLDVLTEEQSEDVHKMGAVGPLKEGYFDTRFLTFLRKRAPWLVVLFFGGFLTTHVMRSFSAELAAVTTLSFYLPLLIAAGGNSGAQSSTLVIRSLAMGDLKSRDWWRVLWRETLQGLTLGGLLALLGVGRALIAGDGPAFAVLVGSTIVLVVLAGCVIGAMIPLLLHRAGIDPATSSTPFIASLVDVMGILVYLSLAQVLLSVLAVLPSATP